MHGGAGEDHVHTQPNVRHARRHQPHDFTGDGHFDGYAAFSSRAASAAVEPTNRSVRDGSGAGDDFCGAAASYASRPYGGYASRVCCGRMWRQPSSARHGHSHSDGNFRRSEPFRDSCVNRSIKSTFLSIKSRATSPEVSGFFIFG